MVDDSADRQRGQPAASERAELPRRDPSSRRTSIRGRDAAANYGAIGATIGHEISHSFDDQGSQFDAQGRLANWWTPQDLEHFKAAGEALAAQYDAYRPFPDLAINGHQVLSENIADLAGLAAAYDAYHLSLNGKPARRSDFFISFAQSWRNKSARGADPAAGRDRRPCARRVSRRNRPQPRSVVRGVRRDAGAEDVSCRRTNASGSGEGHRFATSADLRLVAKLLGYPDEPDFVKMARRSLHDLYTPQVPRNHRSACRSGWARAAGLLAQSSGSRQSGAPGVELNVDGGAAGLLPRSRAIPGPPRERRARTTQARHRRDLHASGSCRPAEDRRRRTLEDARRAARSHAAQSRA